MYVPGSDGAVSPVTIPSSLIVASVENPGRENSYLILFAGSVMLIVNDTSKGCDTMRCEGILIAIDPVKKFPRSVFLSFLHPVANTIVIISADSRYFFILNKSN